MKPLNQFTNTEKARVLHRLFPGEIPALLDHIQCICRQFLEHETRYRQNWDVGFFDFDAWLRLAVETNHLIVKHREELIRSSNVFADQLCFSYTSLFVNDQIVKYADQRCENEKFKLAVALWYK